MVKLGGIWWDLKDNLVPQWTLVESNESRGAQGP